MPIIKVNRLTKIFKRREKADSGFVGTLNSLFHPKYVNKTAVNSISFEIEKGEIVGYIGPNGAGKSTTIKMLAGILVPSAGAIEVDGFVPWQDRSTYVKKIGVVFGQRTHLWWDVPVIDSLYLLRDIYKIPEPQFRRNLDIFNEVLGLKEFQAVPVRQLSLGQRVRADIAAALLHEPSILFLDEPTVGVDVVSKDLLRKFLKELVKEKKVTVLLTTHDMNEIEKLCQRIIIIDHGQILYDGSIEQIRAKYSNERILSVEFENEIPDFTLPYTTLKRSEGRKKWFCFNRFQTSASDLISEMSKQFPVSDLIVEEPEIEEIIRTIYLKKAQEQTA
jgi:ABC-2 type transport system ATP-binding protein